MNVDSGQCTESATEGTNAVINMIPRKRDNQEEEARPQKGTAKDAGGDPVLHLPHQLIPHPRMKRKQSVKRALQIRARTYASSGKVGVVNLAINANKSMRQRANILQRMRAKKEKHVRMHI